MPEKKQGTVIIFSHAYLPFLGGAETAIKGITDEITNFNFIMITARTHRSLARAEKIGNIMVYRLGFGFSFDKVFLPIFAFLKFLTLRKNFPRPIIFWGMMVSYGSIGAYFVKLLNPYIPFLLTLQEGDSEIHIRRARFGLVGFFWRRLIKNADKIQVISSYLADLAKSFGARSQIEIIPNGVDLKKFENPDRQKTLILQQNLGIKPDEKIIITVSRLVQKNAVDVLIKAFAIIYKKYPDAELWIVGDGPEFEKLMAEAGKFSKDCAVKFFGNIPNEEIPKYLNESYIFIRPSRSEGLGTAFLEAMAAGLPIIATKVGGIRDFLQDGETGLAVKVDDPKDLAEKIDRLFSDPALREKLIQNGWKLVEEKYQWSKIAAKMDKLFASLLFLNSLPAGRRVKNMRILIATGIYPPDVGGPATYSKYLADELPKRGHEVKVLVYSKIARGIPKGFSHFRFLLAILKKVGWADLILVTDTISSGLPVYLASLLTGKPYILKIGGDYVWEQSFQRWGVLDLLDEFLKKKYGLKIEFMRRIQSRVARHAKMVLTPSNYLASVAMSWGVEESRLSVIYNTVEMPKVLISKSEKSVLFSFGRDVPWKGFEMLREIAKDFPEAVFKIGEVSREERDRLFAVCNIFLLNTGYEGFSHQLLEAMALGLPIITTNAGGNKEIVRDGENALIAGYNDSGAWVKAITRLLSDKNLQQKLSENAKKTAQNFLQKDMIGETLEILNKIIRNK